MDANWVLARAANGGDRHPSGSGSAAPADVGEDGFDPGECSKDEKIAYLWQLYLQTETDLNAALKNAELQRQQHAEEMKEVEAYVEHIRALSDERETLTLELEAENERLRKLAEPPADVAILLEQQGFEDSVASMTMAELVVFLLVDRARLMTSMAEEKTEQNSSLIMEEIFKQKISQMTQDFEEEREGLSKHMSAFLEEHIREMDQLMQEKELADRQLAEATERADELSRALQERTARWEEEAPQREGTENGRRPTAADDTGDEVSLLRKSLSVAEAENAALAGQLSAVLDELVEKQSECTGLRADVTKLLSSATEVSDVYDGQHQRLQQTGVHGTDLSDAAGGEALENDLSYELSQLKETLSAREEELRAVTLSAQHSLDRAEQREKQLSLATAEIKSLKEQVQRLRGETASLQQENATLRELGSEEVHSRADFHPVSGSRPGSSASFSSSVGRGERLEAEITAHYDESQAGVIQQLEADLKDLNKKLHEAYFRCEQSERQLRKEKLRCKELSVRNSAEVERQIKGYFCDIESEISQLRQRTLPSRMSEVSTPDLLAVKLELVQVRLQHQKEIDDLALKLQQTELEASMLRESLAARQEELQSLRSGDSKLQTSLATEVRLRKQAEEWNHQLQSEASKLWDKVRELTEQKTRLEAENSGQREKLEQYQALVNNENFMHCARETDNSKSLELARARVAKAEQEIAHLRANLENVKCSLSQSEKQLEELSAVKEQVSEQSLRVKQLKNQLHEEQRHRLAEANHCDDLRKQLSQARDKEAKLREQVRELQHTLIDTEAKVSGMQEEMRSLKEMLDECQRSKRSLALRAEVHAQEIETLQLELLVAGERLRMQLDKYADRRERHREKLIRAREIFNSVKYRLREKVALLEAELRLTREEFRSDEG